MWSVLELLLSFLIVRFVTFDSGCIAQLTWTGILRQKDATATDGLFSPTIQDRTSPMFGLENPTDPTANTFSIIGALANEKRLFQRDDNEYFFKLVYHNLKDETTYNLVWTQNTWLTDFDIIGFEKYASATYTFPTETTSTAYYLFKGLGYSDDQTSIGCVTFLDGNGATDGSIYEDIKINNFNKGLSCWNSVGTIRRYGGGIKAFNGDVAKSAYLCICPANNDCEPDDDCTWNVTGNIISQHENFAYKGPSNADYFESVFNNKNTELRIQISDQSLITTNIISVFDISKFQDVKCGTKLNGEIMASNPINYYKFTITAEMSDYKALLNIQTCCEFEGSIKNLQHWGWSTGVRTNQCKSNCLAPKYRQHCDAESLDTILYILYQKKGYTILIETVDDIDAKQCANKAKSRIDLFGYAEGQYIVGVGGFGKDIGRYFLQLECARYSFPAKATEINPLKEDVYNVGNITCDAMTTGTMFDENSTTMHELAYYHLPITQTTWLPMEIKVCTNHIVNAVFIIKSQYGQDSAYKIVDSISWYSWNNPSNDKKPETKYANTKQVMLDFATLKSEFSWCQWPTGGIISVDDSYINGEYHLVIQWTTMYPDHYALQWTDKNLDRDANDPPKFAVKTICAPAPTLSPTEIPTKIPTLNPSKSPTVEPTYNPTIHPTSNPSNEPTVYPTTYPSNEPTIHPTDFPILDPTSFPSRDPTSLPSGDPTFDPTADPSPAPTKEYTYPIHKAEYQAHLTNTENFLVYPTIACGDVLLNQMNTEENLVSYYTFSITKDLVSPSYITTCAAVDVDFTAKNNTEYVTVLYIINTNLSASMQFHGTIMHRSEYAECNRHSAQIDISSLPSSDYFAAVQGYQNQIGNFSISMVCTEAPPKISREIMMVLIFGSCGFVLMIFLLYYIMEWKQYCRQKRICCYFDPEYVERKSGHESVEDDSSSIDLIAGNNMLLPQTDLDDEYEPNNTTCCFCCDAEFNPENNSLDEKNVAEELKAGTPRLIDSDGSFSDQLANNDNEDVVQLVLAHALQSYQDGQGLDIYQLLAIMYYDKQSRTVKGRAPFSKININTGFIMISPFAITLFMAIIVGLAQTMGITIVIYKLLYAYFEEGIVDICVMYYWRWEQVYSLKILSFLLSLVITFYVTLMMSKMEHAGLYEILNKLKLKHMKRIDTIVLWILLIGQVVNYYACLLAVIGSYFIIFESNNGEEQDDGSIVYSHAGLDMILNAVALFFMLELDDMLVSDQDYNDCAQHLEKILDCYHSDPSINSEYKHKQKYVTACGCDCCEKKEAKHEENEHEELVVDIASYSDWEYTDIANWIVTLRSGFKDKYYEELKENLNERDVVGSNLLNAKRSDIQVWGVTDFDDNNIIYQAIRINFTNDNNKCLKYIIPTMFVSINAFSVFVKICCYGGGFVAPFLIFFCW